MAYNTSKGKREFGDIEFEDDPQNTQIDFEENYLALKVSNAAALIISASVITSSLVFSASQGMYASAFYGDASTLSNMPVTSYVNHSAGRLLIAGNALDTISGEADLFWDDNSSRLQITGKLSASSDMHAATLYLQDSTGGAKLISSTSDLTLRAATSQKHIVAHLSDNNGGGKFKITDNSGNDNASVDSTGGATFSKVTASSEISASSFYGGAEHLKYPIKTVISDYTITLDDYTILVDTESVDCTVTLPAASLADAKIYNIKKTHGLNVLTVNSASGSIDEETEVSITTRNQVLKIQCNGSEWYII